MTHIIFLLVTHALAALGGLLVGQNNPRLAAAAKKIAANAENGMAAVRTAVDRLRK